MSEGALSVADWHQLCSQTTELISEGIVPNKIIVNNQFWDNHVDFIDKGSFLSNPDKEPIHTFDEYLFLKMPTELLSDKDILMDLFSKELTDPSLLPSEMLSKVLYLSFSPKYYREIPYDFRVSSEFKDTMRRDCLHNNSIFVK